MSTWVTGNFTNSDTRSFDRVDPRLFQNQQLITDVVRRFEKINEIGRAAKLLVKLSTGSQETSLEEAYNSALSLVGSDVKTTVPANQKQNLIAAKKFLENLGKYLADPNIRIGLNQGKLGNRTIEYDPNNFVQGTYTPFVVKTGSGRQQALSRSGAHPAANRLNQSSATHPAVGAHAQVAVSHQSQQGQFRRSVENHLRIIRQSQPRQAFLMPLGDFLVYFEGHQNIINTTEHLLQTHPQDAGAILQFLTNVSNFAAQNQNRNFNHGDILTFDDRGQLGSISGLRKREIGDLNVAIGNIKSSIEENPGQKIGPFFLVEDSPIQGELMTSSISSFADIRDNLFHKKLDPEVAQFIIKAAENPSQGAAYFYTGDSEVRFRSFEPRVNVRTGSLVFPIGNMQFPSNSIDPVDGQHYLDRYVDQYKLINFQTTDIENMAMLPQGDHEDSDLRKALVLISAFPARSFNQKVSVQIPGMSEISSSNLDQLYTRVQEEFANALDRMDFRNAQFLRANVENFYVNFAQHLERLHQSNVSVVSDYYNPICRAESIVYKDGAFVENLNAAEELQKLSNRDFTNAPFLFDCHSTLYYFDIPAGITRGFATFGELAQFVSNRMDDPKTAKFLQHVNNTLDQVQRMRGPSALDYITNNECFYANSGVVSSKPSVSVNNGQMHYSGQEGFSETHRVGFVDQINYVRLADRIVDVPTLYITLRDSGINEEELLYALKYLVNRENDNIGHNLTAKFEYALQSGGTIRGHGEINITENSLTAFYGKLFREGATYPCNMLKRQMAKFIIDLTEFLQARDVIESNGGVDHNQRGSLNMHAMILQDTPNIQYSGEGAFEALGAQPPRQEESPRRPSSALQIRVRPSSANLPAVQAAPSPQATNPLCNIFDAAERSNFGVNLLNPDDGMPAVDLRVIFASWGMRSDKHFYDDVYFYDPSSRTLMPFSTVTQVADRFRNLARNSIPHRSFIAAVDKSLSAPNLLGTSWARRNVSEGLHPDVYIFNTAEPTDQLFKIPADTLAEIREYTGGDTNPPLASGPVGDPFNTPGWEDPFAARNPFNTPGWQDPFAAPSNPLSPPSYQGQLPPLVDNGGIRSMQSMEEDIPWNHARLVGPGDFGNPNPDMFNAQRFANLNEAMQGLGGLNNITPQQDETSAAKRAAEQYPQQLRVINSLMSKFIKFEAPTDGSDRNAPLVSIKKIGTNVYAEKINLNEAQKKLVKKRASQLREFIGAIKREDAQVFAKKKKEFLKQRSEAESNSIFQSVKNRLLRPGVMSQVNIADNDANFEKIIREAIYLLGLNHDEWTEDGVMIELQNQAGIQVNQGRKLYLEGGQEVRAEDLAKRDNVFVNYKKHIKLNQAHLAQLKASLQTGEGMRAFIHQFEDKLIGERLKKYNKEVKVAAGLYSANSREREKALAIEGVRKEDLMNLVKEALGDDYASYELAKHLFAEIDGFKSRHFQRGIRLNRETLRPIMFRRGISDEQFDSVVKEVFRLEKDAIQRDGHNTLEAFKDYIDTKATGDFDAGQSFGGSVSF